jgi:hypothetical protein
MAKNYVYSTLSCDQNYADHKLSAAGQPVVNRVVLIKGGANIMSDQLITPKGVVTEVSDDELAFLNTHELFLIHVKNGFLKVSKGQALDPDKVAASSLEAKDASAPLVESDVSAEVKVVSNASETTDA